MIKVASIVGARPQFIKAGPVSRALRSQNMHEVLIHTGQHYDQGLSGAFFEELGIPSPEHNLGVGSGDHAAQTGAMLSALGPVLLTENPDVVLVYGDTNTTLAGALAASKLGFPLAHVESGLRSFERSMPEEVNRVVTDHLSSFLFCPSETAVTNLEDEGISAGVFLVGDVMKDVFLERLKLAKQSTHLLDEYGVGGGDYVVTTIHRAANTDDPARLQGVIGGLREVTAHDVPVIFPVHPRTRKAILRDGIHTGEVMVIEPLPYLSLLTLQSFARCVVTDSGGVQKEAYWAGVPCVTVRDSTEWTETLAMGWNRLVGAEARSIAEAVLECIAPSDRPELYGDGQAAPEIARLLRDNLTSE